MRNFIICILRLHHYGHQIKENEIGRVYIAYMRDAKNTCQ